MSVKNLIKDVEKMMEKVIKELKINKIRDDVYNQGTAVEQKASVFVINLEACVLNKEWYELNEKSLKNLLYHRFLYSLDSVFDKE